MRVQISISLRTESKYQHPLPSPLLDGLKE